MTNFEAEYVSKGRYRLEKVLRIACITSANILRIKEKVQFLHFESLE